MLPAALGEGQGVGGIWGMQVPHMHLCMCTCVHAYMHMHMQLSYNINVQKLQMAAFMGIMFSMFNMYMYMYVHACMWHCHAPRYSLTPLYPPPEPQGAQINKNAIKLE